MDVIARVQRLASERNWTEYRLVKESGLPSSTIANVYHRETIPSVATLETLCRAFGITLSQFFSDGEFVSLTSEQEQLLAKWSTLPENQKEALLNLIDTMN